MWQKTPSNNNRGMLGRTKVELSRERVSRMSNDSYRMRDRMLVLRCNLESGKISLESQAEADKRSSTAGRAEGSVLIATDITMQSYLSTQNHCNLLVLLCKESDNSWVKQLPKHPLP